jgi:hypothetical protein
MPTSLIPLPDGENHVDDSSYGGLFSILIPEWSPENKMQQVFSETSPALAVFQEKLY